MALIKQPKSKLQQLWDKCYKVLGPILIILGLIDQLLKLKILNGFYLGLIFILSIIWHNPYESIVIVWLVLLTLYAFMNKKNSVNPALITTELVSVQKKEIEQLSRNFEKRIELASEKIQMSVNDKILDLRRRLIEFEIDRHLKNNQVGALRKMIDKLDMDLKIGFGAEDTLQEIREYIKKDGCPNFYWKDLNNQIKKVPDDYKMIKDEILEIAHQKLYNPIKT